MNYQSELKELVVNVKKILAANMSDGIEFPPLAIDEVGSSENTEHEQENALENLQRSIDGCKRCKLSRERKHIVFGEGAPGARLIFIGEGPGREEDLEGRPFVGEAGKLLTRIIENGMGIRREEVYICNIVKCRPPGNRDPEKNEIECCIPFLKKQIEIIKPEVICTLGRIAARELLERDFKITMERGRWQTYLNIPVMPTYHPAYIIRNRGREKLLKKEVWEDIQKIMSLLGLEVKKNG